MKNPVETYLNEKTAVSFGTGLSAGLRGSLRPGAVGYRIGRGAVNVGLAATGAGAVAGATYGVQKLYDAATKARDFRSMLDANPDLAQKHEEDPRVFNQMFSTLRTFNPAFTRDPIVAGAYIRRMVDDPMAAGAHAVEALQYRDKVRNTLGEQVSRTVFHRAEK